jgi:DNA-binding beta-propeller fold protein YncE
MEKTFVFLLLAITLNCCGKSKKTKIRKINPINVKGLQEDTSLSLYTLTCGDSSLIASDRKTNQVSIFNYNDLSVSTVIGGTGHGPGEFNGAFYAVLAGKKLYVTDDGNRRITVFNTNDRSLDTTLTHISSPTRFVASDGSLYLYAPNPGHPAPFMMMGIVPKSVTYFGKWTAPGKPVPEEGDAYNLLLYHHTIIAVSQINPLVKFFSKKGKLLSTVNLSKDKDLAQALAYKKKFRRNPANRNAVVILFQDASIYKNDLIINFATHSSEHNYTSNNYLVYKIDGRKLKKIGSFKTNIHGGFTFSFCTHDGKLYSNGGPGGINIFMFDLSFL